jgi:RimJ/RimL family protein N-acetyltransferase
MLIQQEITIPGNEAKPELYLRPIEPSDLNKLSPYDPQIGNFLPPKYVDICKGLCAGDTATLTGLEAEPDAAYWGIFSSEAMLGFTGLHSIVTQNNRDLHSRGIGIVLNSQDFGKGVASRTHPYRSWYAFAERGLEYVSGKAVAENKHSLRAVCHAGYVALGPTIFPGMEDVDAVLVRQYNPERFGLDEVIEMASKTAVENGKHDLKPTDVETAYKVTQENLARLRTQL